MAETDADVVLILSSELIAKVMEVYFKEEMFKLDVKIVDLKPSNDGYAFSLAFDTDKGEKETVNIAKVSVNGRKKDSKGKFVGKLADKELYHG